jgi:hypothetical protein
MNLKTRKCLVIKKRILRFMERMTHETRTEPNKGSEDFPEVASGFE